MFRSSLEVDPLGPSLFDENRRHDELGDFFIDTEKVPGHFANCRRC